MKIIKVVNPQDGVQTCKDLLYEIVSKNSVLFLSGGSTPKTLYQELAKEKKLNVGAVAMVDERYFTNLKLKTENLKLGTNEFMIKNTQLLLYLAKSNTKFYPILENEEIAETVSDYDETVRFLFNYFGKSLAILGVGIDGHTAGIPAGIQNSKFKIQNETDLVTSFDNFPGDFKERITLTFLGLSKFDQIIVMAFGKDKKKALKLMLKSGSVTKIPARFLTQKEIIDKVILITDQSV
jgi:6-phosphogluconolactonase/glucosamine-6-phosphate isomerase/deaminase